MPIYEYECRRCGHRFELLQKLADKPRKRCPECSGAVDRLISPPAIRFKGTGWYVTDYAGKDKPEGKGDATGKADAKGKADAEGGAKSEAGTDKAKKDKKKTGAKGEKKAS